jgi:hypothetical protein
LRLQLTAVVAAIAASGPAAALADDAVDFTTTWYQEQRRGGHGGLTVVHPQLDVGVDTGDSVTIELGYAADAVTGATATVYAVDAVSTATPFSDVRHEGRLGVGFLGKRSTFSVGATAGAERDYLSLAVTGAASIDLPGRNTSVALTYTHNFDRVCDRDNADLTPLERRALTGLDPCDVRAALGRRSDDEVRMLGTVWRHLQIDTIQATVTQNLSPTANVQMSLYGQVVNGFQSNPYRRVRVGANEPQEHVPGVRGRRALAVRVNRFLPSARSAIHASLRGYNDTWGVNSGTAELAYSQYAGSSLLLRFRARVYQQSAATFFKDAFFYETEGPAGAYFTGDRELSPVRNVLVGAKLTVLTVADHDRDVWGVFDKLQLTLKADLLMLDELAADDPDRNLRGRDRQFLHSGQLLDAFTLAIGILGDY